MMKYSKGVDTTILHILYLKLFLSFGIYLSKGRACIVKSIHDFCNTKISNYRRWEKQSYLIFIYLPTLQFRFTLFLEGNNYQGNEYIYKEEWEHYEVDYVENGHFYSKILNRTSIIVRCRHGILKDSGMTVICNCIETQIQHLLRPSFSCLHGKQCEHSHSHIVVVKTLKFPFSLFYTWHVVILFVHKILTPVAKHSVK